MQELEVVSPFNGCGGIVAFARKRDVREVEDVGRDGDATKHTKRELHLNGTSDLQSTEDKEQCQEPEAEQNSIHGSSLHCQSVEADVYRRSHDGLNQSEETHVVQVFTNSEATPFFLRVKKDATVGSITVAEDELKTMKQPIGIRDVIGQPIPLASTTCPFQQLFLNYIPEYALRQASTESVFQGRFEADQWVACP